MKAPTLLNGRNTTLMRPGMIVTDEPGVYEAGEVGIRIENEIECYHKADNQYGTFLAFRPLTFVPIATSPIVPGVLGQGAGRLAERLSPQSVRAAGTPPDRGRARMAGRESAPPSAAMLKRTKVSCRLPS